jgi:hypothetical protein
VSRLARRRAGWLVGFVSLLAAACGGGSGSGGDSGGSGGDPGGGVPPPPPPVATTADFRDEVVYQILTDRFANGDASNDSGLLDRRGDAVDRANPVGWHGGDFAGIQRKIEEGYFQRMGFTAIWISRSSCRCRRPATAAASTRASPSQDSTATGPSASM